MRYNYFFEVDLCKQIGNVIPPRSNKKTKLSFSTVTLSFQYHWTRFRLYNWYMPVTEVGLAASLLQQQEEGLLCN